MTTSTAPRKTLRCRFTFHSWEWANTTDGARFVRCGRCHKEKDSGAGGMWTAGAGIGGIGGSG